MSALKKLLISLLIATFSLTFAAQSGAVDIEDEQWIASDPALKKFVQLADPPHSYVLEEVANENTVVSHLFANYESKNPQDFERYICTNTTEGKCATPTRYVYSSVFPTCLSGADINCVGSLTAIGADGKALEAKFVEYAVPNHFNNFKAVPELGIPEGSTGGIWSIPGAPHKFGDKYAVFVIADGIAQEGNARGWPNAYANLSARIIPVSIQATTKRDLEWGTHQDNMLRPDTKANTRGGPMYDNNEGFRCVSPYGTNRDQCLVAHAFPENTRFKLQVQLPMAPLGWLHGRMIDPAIDIAKTGNNYTITVEANAARIPTVFHTAKWSELSPSLQAFWETVDSNCNFNDCGFRSSNNYSEPIAKQTTFLSSASFGTQALRYLKTYLPVVKDTAIVAPSTWSWRTLPKEEMSTANGCFTAGDGVKGIVTTNASAYSAGPPAFVDGTLNYQVAAPHFNRDGTVFKGDYTLVLDSKVARCLYKFSNAPIQATISVVNDKGEQSVATTTVTEKNGWLRLIARNFEFSSPSISVKLTQEAPAAEVVKPVTPTFEKKTTITCVKGKTTKKVTAVKPACPAGYKKK